jgi:hypothetical protein
VVTCEEQLDDGILNVSSCHIDMIGPGVGLAVGVGEFATVGLGVEVGGAGGGVGHG